VFEGRMDSAESIRGRDTSVVEYDLATLMKKSKPNFGPWDPRRHVAQNIKVREMSKYPAVTRDISFWWPKREEDIFACIEALNLELLRSVVVADRFEKNGQTSYKITCRYQSDERTLMKQEVDVVEQAVKQALIAQGGTIR
jgi:phenylalanyl-tRNA synthetase beta subunit